MMNVSDSFVMTKNSFDFEECTVSAMEIDSWESNQISGTSAASNIKDNTIISIFTESIEMFGSSMAPWPSSKSVPEQVAGLFITSELESPKQEKSPSNGFEANKPIVQSKLRRSNSSKSRRFSISRVNEENQIDAQKYYMELEPIPIVSSGEGRFQAVPAKDVSLFDPKTDQQPNRSKYSRLQSWLSSLYSRNNSIGKTKDEEIALPAAHKIKGILKKHPSERVQKSVSISENEVIKMSQELQASPPPSSNNYPQKQKKQIKVRFDNEVNVCETFHKEDYCRQSLDYVARQLTPALALSIKKELNAVKQEMEIHEESRHLTQFYLIK